MITDFFLEQGSTHHICQDYAVAGKDWIAVADGCSMSAHSDWGARLLCKAAEKVLQHSSIMDEDFSTLVRGEAMAYAMQLGLEWTDMLATLLVAKRSGPDIQIGVMGDGYLVGCRKDGVRWLTGFNYSTNAPYYLAYGSDAEALDRYNVMFGRGVLHHTVTNLDNGEVMARNTVDCRMHIMAEYEAVDLDFIGLTTDGLNSFTKLIRNDTSVEKVELSAAEVVLPLLSTQLYTNAFLQRRCRKAMDKFNKEGVYHYDDFAMAGLWLGDGE